MYLYTGSPVGTFFKVCRKAIGFWYGSDGIHALNMLKWVVG